MYVIKILPEFDSWLKGPSDKTAQRRLVGRLRKASLGNLGDVQPVGKGVASRCASTWVPAGACITP